MENYRIADIELSESGNNKIEWAWESMPVLKSIRDSQISLQPFRGLTVAACLHLEAKTACLLEVLAELGATVVATGSNPLSTQDDVCAGLVSSGVNVFSHRGMSTQEYFANLRTALEFHPDIVIDDGADMIALLHKEMPHLISSVLGGSEETTTGVNRLKAMEADDALKIPVIAVNDAKSKYLFDNRYGTGQSVLDGVMRTTNHLIAGKSVVVAGYGWCGRGVALRASAFGARVIVVEVDPHRAFEAVMDGYEVMSMDMAASRGNIFLTLTGNTDVIRKEHFKVMKDGVLLGNAGHFDVEINKQDLEDIAVSKRSLKPNIETYKLENGRNLHLLAEGRLVNLAAGDGHPVEIMDLSFALQLESAIRLTGESLSPGVYNVPSDIDRKIMEVKLGSMNIKLEKLTPAQELYLKSWTE